jgi:hypothetical protein
MRLPGNVCFGKCEGADGCEERVESVEPEEYGDANAVLMCLTSCDGVTLWEVLLGIVPYRGLRGVSSRWHRSFPLSLR